MIMNPANVCLRLKEGKPSCHGCGGSCKSAGHANSDGELVEEITKRVMAALNK